MPTGYTADVQDGKITEFPDFAMQCARAFGALIMLREEPFSTPVPDKFEPNTSWAEKALAAAWAERERIVSMSDVEADKAATDEHDAMVEERAVMRAERKVRRDRYEAMLQKVRDWTPPSTDHHPLKSFMLEQLHTSISSDCDDGIEKYGKQPVRQTGSKWRRERLKDLRVTIERHEASVAKEIERTEGRNRWLSELRASLPSQERPA